MVRAIPLHTETPVKREMPSGAAGGSSFRQILQAVCTVIFLAIYGLVAAAPALAETRVALVVGNSNYSFSPLANPGNDAQDVAAALKEAGFEVRLLLDADKAEIEAAAAEVNRSFDGTPGVGLFFFAGHGVQDDGQNYLIGVSSAIADAAELKQKSVAAADIVNAMSSANPGLNIVILDACRNNPFTNDVSGLSRIEGGANQFISLSTAPGQVALDGSGRNSPYTKHLTLSLRTPGLSLEETFKRTLKGVYQETAGQQVPFLTSSFFGNFVFRDGAPPPQEAVKTAPQTRIAEAPSLEQSEEADRTQLLDGAERVAALLMPQASDWRPKLQGVYVANGSNPDGSRYRGMLTLNENDGRYDFKWWIAGQVFEGVGELAGRMMVVNWGAKHPVVYSFGKDGLLDGEWADGSAKDYLQPFSHADRNGVPANGRYRVDGRNADGSSYSGTVDIEGDGDFYSLHWRIGQTSYRGRGRLNNGLLVVDWGAAEPVIYAVRADGSLAGLWNSGRAYEINTPQ